MKQECDEAMSGFGTPALTRFPTFDTRYYSFDRKGVL